VISLHVDQDFAAVRFASISAYRQSRSNDLFDPITSPISLRLLALWIPNINSRGAAAPIEYRQ